MEELDELQQMLGSTWDRPDPERAIEICSEFDVLGLGGRRIVLAAGSGVAKLAWQPSGIFENEIEHRLYGSASPGLASLLCPVLGQSPKGILFQSLCTPTSFEALGERGRRVMQRLAGAGISDVAVNLGLFEGRVVCYDYATISVRLWGELFGDPDC